MYNSSTLPALQHFYIGGIFLYVNARLLRFERDVGISSLSRNKILKLRNANTSIYLTIRVQRILTAKSNKLPNCL